MTKTFNRLIAAAVLLTTVHAGRAADAPDTFSPVVSYQFEDSLAESDAQTPIISPIVAYQYYDWPGDENLIFQNSLAVSYFYYYSGGLTLTGTVSTPTGTRVPGAQITFKRVGAPFSLATSDANGVFTAPGLATPASYTLTVTKSGYVTKITNLAFTGAGTQAFDLQLTPLPPAPTTVAVNRDVPPSAVRLGPDQTDPAHPRLELFDGGQLIYDLSGIKKDRMTVVISHGWVPTLPPGNNNYATALDWPKDLGAIIQSYHPGLTNPPNVLVWDWRHKANTFNPKVDDAAEEGVELGKALYAALGSGYHQHLHFIGHSLGVIVNRYACDYVHGNLSGYQARDNPAPPLLVSVTQPHFTMLDEAEVAAIAGTQVLTSAAVAGAMSGLQSALITGVVLAKLDWKYPIPSSARWVDNYISLVGQEHAEAVNVCLPLSALETANPIAAHGYAHDWYRGTVSAPGAAAPVGYGSSVEAGHAFPPGGSGLQPGSFWLEDVTTPSAFDLIFDPHPVPYQASSTILASLSLAVGSFATHTLNGVGQSVLNGYGASIQFARNAGGITIYKTGEVTSQSLEKIGLWWDAAQDKATDFANSITADRPIDVPLTAGVFGLLLHSTPANQANSAGRGRNSTLAAAGAPGQPAAAWVTVNVPADAGMMAFDFTVTGDPLDDRLACAINDQNVFTLPAKFAPDGQTVSTDMMDVSAYAGQNVELFFGLVGGTSTNCQVAVDGIRFITIPPPQVAISSVAGKAIIQWPSAATGWVLETSDNLVSNSWQTVPTDNSVTVSDGVVTLEQPMTDRKRFYRLRRNP